MRKGASDREGIKIALVDNDYVVHASTEIASDSKNDQLQKFLRAIKKELVPGQTAHLEVEGLGSDTRTFEISLCE